MERIARIGGEPSTQPASAAYSPPRLTVIGTVADLTLTHDDWITKCWPYVNKTIGPPDFFTFIPVTSCSP